MSEWNRRRFIARAGLAVSGGFAAWPLLHNRDLFAQAPSPAQSFPDEILNPVEVSGADAQPVMGRLPGAKRMYVLPNDAGEFHRIGSQVMKFVARAADTDGVYELMTFAGNTGAVMPRHAHLGSHAVILVIRGQVELELGDERWTMMRGDFANVPPATPHGWTMRSEGAQFALFSMNGRVGSAFTAMGDPQAGPQVPANVPHDIPDGRLARASFAGDFQRRPSLTTAPTPVRVANTRLAGSAVPYVIVDGAGDRYGGNTFLARNAQTNGQFLVIITEGGVGPGVPAHFHARHFENFFGLDGETLAWAYGKAVPLRMGDFIQAPPRNLHGFRLTQQYNRFAAFLTPGIFENFFTRGAGPPDGARGPAGAREGGERGRAGGDGRAGGSPRGGAPSGDALRQMFLGIQMSGRGPDGYPLDVHPPKLPLPPQDPIWTGGAASALQQRSALLAHASAICGGPQLSREITPELRRALALKRRPEEFL